MVISYIKWVLLLQFMTIFCLFQIDTFLILCIITLCITLWEAKCMFIKPGLLDFGAKPITISKENCHMDFHHEFDYAVKIQIY